MLSTPLCEITNPHLIRELEVMKMWFFLIEFQVEAAQPLQRGQWALRIQRIHETLHFTAPSPVSHALRWCSGFEGLCCLGIPSALVYTTINHVHRFQLGLRCECKSNAHIFVKFLGPYTGCTTISQCEALGIQRHFWCPIINIAAPSHHDPLIKLTWH